MTQVILITGTSSGFGRMAAETLAKAGHIVYGSMRDIAGRNAQNHTEADAFAKEHGVSLTTLEIDVTDEATIGAAVEQIIADKGQIDVLIHNAGHMCVGPTEAFEPEQLLAMYDVNVVGTQRVNRAVLPYMRAAKSGLVLWVGSSSTAGGTPPYLAPYFAAKAGMDALAVSYAGELARWGVETTILVPGAFTKGTNHFHHAGHAADEAVVKAYDDGPTAGMFKTAIDGLTSLEPDDADPQSVAVAILDIVNVARGKRPVRVHVDPLGDGAEEVDRVKDRIHADMLRRMGLGDVLTVRT